MATGNCYMGSRRSVRALQEGEILLVVSEGELPHPGYRVDIEESLLDVEPPEFSLRFCELPGLWPQVITPYRYGEVFTIGSRRTAIRVHHSEGTDEVAVEGLDGQLKGLAMPGPGADEATGLSRNMSFDEAFADALGRLPSLTPQHPDAMSTVKVQEVGAVFGGIAGFRHLYVKVQRASD